MYKERGKGRTTAPLTPFSFPSPSSQTPPRENVLPNSSLLSTATRTGELDGGRLRKRCGDGSGILGGKGPQPSWKIMSEKD